MIRVFRLLVEYGGAAEALGDVDNVPTGDAACPVGGVAVDFLAQVQKRFVAGTIVKPVNAGEVVTGTLVLPEGQQKIFVGNGQLPVEIPGHQLNDALIAGILVVRL
ncbi:hypothetical protein ES703_95722 [subsurface metagenome]